MKQDVGGGFTVVDEKGRVSLPKQVRGDLGLDAGASVAWVAIGGIVALIPQDRHLAELFDQAQASLAAAGLTSDDLEAELESVRAEVVAELYGADKLAELERKYGPVGSALPPE